MEHYTAIIKNTSDLHQVTWRDFCNIRYKEACMISLLKKTLLFIYIFVYNYINKHV